MQNLLKDKKVVILGVANERSIAWGIAQAFKAQGAKVALSYMNEAIEKRVKPLADELGADFTFEMDVTIDDHYPMMADLIKKNWGSVDILVHSLAFAEREDLKNPFSQTSRQGFLKACDISAFSLVGLTQALTPLFNPYASVMAMTYYGSEKVIKNYNVMGVAKAALEASVRYLADDLGEKSIRVNAISAGPIKTLAASGISGFRELLAQVEERAPLRENIGPEDVAGTALYLASDLAKHVTGQTIYVDSGLSILGF
jgi:enoyl-[acyl-carrier protein] reductase I